MRVPVPPHIYAFVLGYVYAKRYSRGYVLWRAGVRRREARP